MILIPLSKHRVYFTGTCFQTEKFSQKSHLTGYHHQTKHPEF